MHVIIDHRETASEVSHRLRQDPEVEVRIGRLHVGDYVVDGTVKVERTRSSPKRLTQSAA